VNPPMLILLIIPLQLLDHLTIELESLVTPFSLKFTIATD